jgi:hypothetical protein
VRLIEASLGLQTHGHPPELLYQLRNALSHQARDQHTYDTGRALQGVPFFASSRVTHASGHTRFWSHGSVVNDETPSNAELYLAREVCDCGLASAADPSQGQQSPAPAAVDNLEADRTQTALCGDAHVARSVSNQARVVIRVRQVLRASREFCGATSPAARERHTTGSWTCAHTGAHADRIIHLQRLKTHLSASSSCT